MVTAMVIMLCSSFLFHHAAPVGHASRTNGISFNTDMHARHPRSLTSRSAIVRAPQPLAFDGGLDVLSEDEIKGLLAARGIVSSPAASKHDLITLLKGTDVDSPSETNIPSSLLPMEENRVGIFERVAPSVVYIQTSIVQSSPFSMRQSEYPAGAGSGFVWDSAGHVVTNFHVINGGPLGPRRRGEMPRKLMVKLMGSDELFEATVVGTEPDKDLAVLKLDESALSLLKPIEIGCSSALRVGQSALCIGNPFGLDWTLTQGIVSALGRDINGAGGRPIKDCIQTDAAINPGNSGGPMLDSRGNLLGVNTMIYSPGGLGANVGIGFAVPVDTVKRVVNQIIEFGPGARPSLGVSVLPDQMRRMYAKNLNRDLGGAIIAEVVPGSPADELKLAPCVRRPAGVLLGDMITAVNGQAIKCNEDLLCAIEEAEPDQPLGLTVMRGCDPQRAEELFITPVRRKMLSDATR